MKQLKNLTTIDLANMCKWENVQKAIAYHYPTDKSNYKGLFLRIQKTKPKKHKDFEELIYVATTVPEIYTGDSQKYWDMFKTLKDFADDV